MGLSKLRVNLTVSDRELALIEKVVLSIRLLSRNYIIAGVEYKIRMVPSRNPHGTVNGIPVEYFYTQGWSIYLWRNIPRLIKRIALYHELVEINYVRLGYDVPEAHQMALVHETDFVIRNFGEDALAEVIGFRQKYPPEISIQEKIPA